MKIKLIFCLLASTLCVLSAGCQSNQMATIPGQAKFYAVCSVTGDGSKDHPPTPGRPCSGSKDHTNAWCSVAIGTWEAADNLGWNHDCTCHMGVHCHRVVEKDSRTGDFLDRRSADFVVVVVNEAFVVRLVKPEQIALARARIAGSKPQGIISGRLAAGDGGFNQDPKSKKAWSWHMVPETVSFPQLAEELCDGKPSDVEMNTSYWVGQVKAFCPWSAKRIKELK